VHCYNILFSFNSQLTIFNTLFRPVDEIVKFPGLETFPASSYAIRQLISREIELKQLRNRMPVAEFNNVTKEVDQIDENEKNSSTPKSAKG